MINTHSNGKRVMLLGNCFAYFIDMDTQRWSGLKGLSLNNRVGQDGRIRLVNMSL